LGEALAAPATGYSVVYHVELYLMFATLIALGPLVRNRTNRIPAVPYRSTELPVRAATV
jgi:BCD family chlorophyll transporter-like MFS transporter